MATPRAGGRSRPCRGPRRPAGAPAAPVRGPSSRGVRRRKRRGRHRRHRRRRRRGRRGRATGRAGGSRRPPPLGRLTPAQAEALAAAAGDGAGEVRVTPWRTVVVPDLTPADAGRWRARLAEAGLVADPASPWLGVTACAGRPGCAKSRADVHADIHAALGDPRPDADVSRDAVRSPTDAGRIPAHWAGCERRCGRPRGRVVDVVATTHGYRVEADGVSRAFPGAEQTSAAVAATREGL
ncbi:hypothetical protein [Microtetraspora malaysiensis]|uniref:hypothetical protein n=1 Tax=Microtetraspora malaysiensis TaxID=161358 RepID=UPI003D8F3055